VQRLIDLEFEAVPVLPHPLAFQEGRFEPIFYTTNFNLDLTIFCYLNGIFPWNEADYPFYWWYTNPRFVIRPHDIHISKNLNKLVKSGKFYTTMDTCFDQVIDHCATIIRKGQRSTWIKKTQKQVFIELHKRGWAHSVEVWRDDQLVGGLYGMALGNVFFGESMFHLETDASKVAFVALANYLSQSGYWLIDCQMETPLLASFGGHFIGGDDFYDILKENLFSFVQNRNWNSE
jgi:leucyl/phenylalanyl-tRNA--protein transferase